MYDPSVYEQIAKRTNGSVYLGVVGPVRTGKSTFVKRFMQELVLPNIEDPYEMERAKDELPQSGSGKTIMTAEPKFIPEEAVTISPDGKTKLKVRLIDSVGYMVPGVNGVLEDGAVRMVTTPWFPEEIPLTQAAELGTKKVMDDHCTVGILVTTDGTVTEIPREDYVDAETRAIADMKASGKPFLVLVNSENPNGEAAKTICKTVTESYEVPAMAVDCLALKPEDIAGIFEMLMYAFPAAQLQFFLPGWVQILPGSNEIKQMLYAAMMERAQKISTLQEAEPTLKTLQSLEQVEQFSVENVDLATGTIACRLQLPRKLFYTELARQTGVPVEDDASLFSQLQQLASMKKRYEKVESALEQVQATGYGIVMPSQEELKLEQPEIVKKNGTYAVKLHASAPSIHMIRADIETEIHPMVGGQQESNELMDFLLKEYENQTENLWQSNLFGKTLYELVSEGLYAKLTKLPLDARQKFTRTLSKAVNENTGGMICILL